MLKINFSSSEQSQDCCSLCANASVLPGKSFINVLLKTCVYLLFFLFCHWISSLRAAVFTSITAAPKPHLCLTDSHSEETADNCAHVCVCWGLWACFGLSSFSSFSVLLWTEKIARNQLSAGFMENWAQGVTAALQCVSGAFAGVVWHSGRKLPVPGRSLVSISLLPSWSFCIS